ncbi:reverse transcriptase-like protein [Pontibacillus yanchengensis]|uniref:Reverse transcriptase-like protein n=2 Tax=Pontibacillus yanchengensis TaxID=462910 RepID=A0ACC7VAP1_9BACI|nr:ribonuclease HI family protein [Pontibacillus yanchengensis]MYL32812.1 reverse transcriptase-like protein [Pontibacillus yanchengensis]MYL51723.1 reverse transcriptase-like protein [Pontibacillus yanchengensis]
MLEVYVDGASQGDPGPSGAGIYIKQSGNHLDYSIYLGNMSNHEAEFMAVIKALIICKDTFPDEIISIRSDSRLVVDSIEKSFTKQTKYQPLLSEVEKLGELFPYFFVKWIPNKQNKRADELARQAIHKQ